MLRSPVQSRLVAQNLKLINKKYGNKNKKTLCEIGMRCLQKDELSYPNEKRKNNRKRKNGAQKALQMV